MIVKIKKLHPDAIIPTYAHPGSDAGLDMTAISLEIVDKNDHGYYRYKTGISLEIPEGYVGLMFPRSSISNTGMILANSVGVIDSGYRGEVEFRFKYIPDTKMYNVGDRVGQLLIIPYPQIEFQLADNLEESIRDEAGFGSTNN